jgi:hypothetical protein
MARGILTRFCQKSVRKILRFFADCAAKKGAPTGQLEITTTV